MEDQIKVKETTKRETILSVSNAEQLLINWKRNGKEPDDQPTYIVESMKADNNNRKLITGTSAEYHNLASEFARNDLYQYATDVAQIGTEKYRRNVDLLADIVKFGSQCQRWDACKKAYDRLQTIDKKMWTWRTYTFVIDYLQDKMETPSDEAAMQKQAEAARKEIEDLIESYKALKDERAWVAEAELKIRFGERDAAITVLKDGAEKVVVAPQCCIKLSDMLLEDGAYEEVVKYASMGLRGTAQDQPSASNGYLLYASALAKDALIHKEALESGGEAKNKGYNNLYAVKDALTDYKIARMLLDRPIFINNIRQREAILRAKSGLDSENAESESKGMEELLRRLAEAARDKES